jgi:hypothetical protein
MTRLLTAVVALAALTHCATNQIKPGPGAQVVPPGVATASASGVRLWVDGNAWKGRPSDLPDVLTPIYVVIENRSGRPLRVMHAQFQLIGASRFRYSPLTFISNSANSPPPPAAPSTPPPSNAPPPPPNAPPPPPNAPSTPSTQPPSSGNPQNTVPSAPVTPGISRVLWEEDSPELSLYQPALAVRAFHRHVGVGFGFYRGPHWWYTDPYPYWGYPYPYYYYSTPIPSQDMITQALPEGTVENGGRVSGFLYFQRVVGRETNLRFEARFPDAKTNESVATIGVPLVVSN